MLKYASSDIAELAHQLTLSPRRLRPRQVEGLERLLEIVAVGKSYPYDLIVFHITGTRPVKQNQKPAISGKHLLGDLPMLADHITRKGAVALAEFKGPFRAHETVASDLGVSTKTIRRWRSRGLLGIRALCPDGTTRLVFSDRAILQFTSHNTELVRRGSSFKLLTDAEKTHLIETARALLHVKRQKLHVIARVLAEQTGRAVETIRYTIRQYDAAHPEQALFARNGEPAVSPRHRSIWTCHQRGETPQQIAAAQDLDVASVEAILRELRVRQLKQKTFDYVDHELFHAPAAAELILNVPRPGAPPTGAKTVRAPKELPAYLRSLYDVPLLTREQEQDLFRRYNFLRFTVARAVEQLEVFTSTQEQLDVVHDALQQVEALKNELIRANLRLVVSIAKRHVGWTDDLFEIISDGNLSLMRAVEKFDFALGNKFSTYASWAIMKNFARTIPEGHYHLRRYVTGQDEMLDAAADRALPQVGAGDIETVRQALRDGMGELDERERTIVSHHFGVFRPDGVGSTLDELGRRFGVTKERVRQIESRAIAKLRRCLSPALLDAYAT